jgi:hypothetical protein
VLRRRDLHAAATSGHDDELRQRVVGTLWSDARGRGRPKPASPSRPVPWKPNQLLPKNLVLPVLVLLGPVDAFQLSKALWPLGIVLESQSYDSECFMVVSPTRALARASPIWSNLKGSMATYVHKSPLGRIKIAECTDRADAVEELKREGWGEHDLGPDCLKVIQGSHRVDVAQKMFDAI